MRFHRYLEHPDNEEVLEEWIISRVCEEFGCDPQKAIKIIDNDYNGLVFRILDLRDYLKAFQIYKQGQQETDLAKRPSGPAIDRVREIVGQLMKEQIAAKIAAAQR